MRNRFAEALRDDGLGARASVGWLASQHLVDHTPEAVDVSPGVQVSLRARLLRAHVGRGADCHAGFGEFLSARALKRARHAEVCHQRVSLTEQDVLGFDVPVDDPVIMRIAQRIRHFPGDLQRILERKLPIAIQPITQRLALHKWHRVPELARAFAGVEDGQDMRVLEPGGELDLALKPVRAQRSGDLRMEDL